MSWLWVAGAGIPGAFSSLAGHNDKLSWDGGFSDMFVSALFRYVVIQLCTLPLLSHDAISAIGNLWWQYSAINEVTPMKLALLHLSKSGFNHYLYFHHSHHHPRRGCLAFSSLSVALA